MSKNKNNIFNVFRLLTAFYFAFKGLKSAFLTETSFQQEIILSFILIPLAFYCGSSNIQRVLLIGSWMLVLIVELLNSAIETLVDRIGEDYHELSGRAKDIGSAAVLVALANAVIIWYIIIFS